jgi:hypothetical protein
VQVSFPHAVWTTVAVFDLPDRSDAVSVKSDEQKTFSIGAQTLVDFQVINDPSNGSYWDMGTTPPYSTFDTTASGWQTQMWNFGEAGTLTIRYRYNPLDAGAVPVLSCFVGDGPYTGPFDRGFCSTEHCNATHGDWPESWVRGRADVDQASGKVSLLMELETDAVDAGPSGVIKAFLQDRAGKTLATITSDPAKIGGKWPGHSRIENFPGTAMVSRTLAQQVQSVRTEAHCTGVEQSLFGVIPLPQTIHFSVDFPSG